MPNPFPWHDTMTLAELMRWVSPDEIWYVGLAKILNRASNFFVGDHARRYAMMLAADLMTPPYSEVHHIVILDNLGVIASRLVREYGDLMTPEMRKSFETIRDATCYRELQQ